MYKIEPDYEQAYFDWQKDPKPETLKGLLTSVDPFISKGIQTYPMEDRGLLKGQAKKIFINSLPKYDPAQTSLRTYMSGQLRGLSRFARNQSNILNIPERIMLDRYKMDAAENEFLDLNGRIPSTSELAKITKLSGRRIQSLRKSVLPQNQGSFMRPTEDGMDQGGPAVAITPVLKTQLEYVYDSLSPEEQVVLEHDYNLYGKKKLSVTDLAKKISKSSATVSQLRKKIDEKIRRTEEILFDR